MFMQRLIDAGLVSAQGAPALQHQHDAQFIRIERIDCHGPHTVK